MRPLGGEGDRLAHAVGGPGPRVLPVEEEAPGGNVPEAQQQVDQGGLAGAARAHDRDAPPRLEAEAHAVEREAGLARVGEAEVAHLEGSRGPAGARPRRLDDRRPLVRHLEEAARRLAGQGRARPRRGQGRHRLERGEGQERHHRQVDPVEAALANRRDREGEDHDHGQVGAEPRERAPQGGGANETLLLAHGPGAQVPHRRCEIRFPPEGENVREALHAVDEPGGELPAKRREASRRRLAPSRRASQGRAVPAEREPGDRRATPASRRRAAGRVRRSP